MTFRSLTASIKSTGGFFRISTVVEPEVGASRRVALPEVAQVSSIDNIQIGRPLDSHQIMAQGSAASPHSACAHQTPHVHGATVPQEIPGPVSARRYMRDNLRISDGSRCAAISGVTTKNSMAAAGSRWVCRQRVPTRKPSKCGKPAVCCSKPTARARNTTSATTQLYFASDESNVCLLRLRCAARGDVSVHLHASGSEPASEVAAASSDIGATLRVLSRTCP